MFQGLPRYRPRRFPWLNAKRRLIWDAWVRARCQPVYVGDNTVLATVLGRFRMYLDARDMSLAAHLMTIGYWEIWVTEVLARVLRNRMTVVDVGANHGYFTLIMARKCMGGQVYAFEPNPHINALLNRNVVVNGHGHHVTCFPDALSDADGRELHLVVDQAMSGGAHLVEEQAVHGREVLTLHTRRLDSIPGARDADVVKIDAEGSELDVWRGMAGMIAGDRLKIVLIEFAPERYPDPEGYLRELLVGGFTLSYIDGYHGIVAATVQDILTDPRPEWMLLLRR